MGSNSRLSGILEAIPTKELSAIYKFAVNCGAIDVALYPLDLADTLIRLGYEPFPPMEQDGFFRGKSLSLPSLPAYVYYLYMIDGFNGLYRGVIPFVTASLINRHLSRYIENLSPFPLDIPEDEPRMMEEFTEINVTHFAQTRFWKLISNVITIHASYPFHVLAVRTMARFVTDATTEEGLRPHVDDTWFQELIRVQDLSELFAGCQARIIREIVFAVISAGAYLAVMRVLQILKPDPDQSEKIEGYVEYFGNSLGGMYTSPFRNASDIMIINRTDIPLGNPPFTDPYNTCWECLTTLRADKFWKGAPLLSDRSYMGPRDIINERLFPRETMFGPYYMPQGYQRGYDDIPGFLQIYYDLWRKMGIQPGTGMDVQGLASILLKRNSGKVTRPGSIGLTGVKSLLLSESRRTSMPFIQSSYGFLGGNSNPLRL